MGDAIAVGPYVFDVASATLARDGKIIGLGTRGAALLRALVEAGGVPVSKTALIEAAWPGVMVEEGNLSVQVAALRKVLGLRPDGLDWIATVPRVGYRFQKSAAAAVEIPAAVVLPSLALLPFQNLSDDPAQEYFVDGVVEDLIAALSRFKSFAVVARSSSFRYRDRTVDLQDVARELGVRYILEGSARKAGQRLRISVRLVDGVAGGNVWARTFDGNVEDVFDFQDQITDGVVALIEPAIQRAEIERSRRERPGSLAAYDLYLRALPHFLTATLSANDEAYKCLAAALALEPDNPTYLAAATRVLLARSVMRWPSVSGDDHALNASYVERALAHGGNDAFVMASCADSLVQELHEYGRGLEMALNAVAANPNNLSAVNIAGVACLCCGDIGDALRYFHRAVELSPRDTGTAWPLAGIAHVHILLGDDTEALKWAEKAVASNAEFVPGNWMVIAACAHLGRMEEAHLYLSRFRARSPAATVASIVAGQSNKDPSRFARVADGLRLAGLPA